MMRLLLFLRRLEQVEEGLLKGIGQGRKGASGDGALPVPPAALFTGFVAEGDTQAPRDAHNVAVGDAVALIAAPAHLLIRAGLLRALSMHGAIFAHVAAVAHDVLAGIGI